MHKSVKVKIPDSITFADLRLMRSDNGGLLLDFNVLDRICEASGLLPTHFRDSHADNVADFIVSWYVAHRKAGGDPDEVADELIAEMTEEEPAFQTVSVKPGIT